MKRIGLADLVLGGVVVWAFGWVLYAGILWGAHDYMTHIQFVKAYGYLLGIAIAPVALLCAALEMGR
jgi:hypothetical protein